MKRHVVALCVLALAALANGAAPPTGGAFAAGPYLLDVTAGEATVAMHLHRPATAAVTVFDSSSRVGTFRSDAAATRHFIRITGLSPGRTYRYEAACGESGPRTPAGDRRYQVRTAGRTGEAFTFAVYGDCRPGETGTQRHHRDVIAQVAAAEPALCLLLGDVVDDGADESLWRAFSHGERNGAGRGAGHRRVGGDGYAAGQGTAAAYVPQSQPGP